MSKQSDYNKRSDAFKQLENDFKRQGMSNNEAKDKAREIDNRASKALNNNK